MRNESTFFRLWPARRGWLVLGAAAGLGFALGCGKSESPTQAAVTPPELVEPAVSMTPTGQLVLATRWIGKARLAEDTNAAYQMELLNLPESAQLAAQTLDKLGRALPGILGAADDETNRLSELIRPLLGDLVQAESFTELREGADSWDFALAIRLSAERSARWQTNLAGINGLQLARAGDWMVVGIQKARLLESGQRSPSSASRPDQKGVFSDFQKRFGGDASPTLDTNAHWLQIEADLSRLLRSNPLFPAEKLPTVLLTLAGEDQTVRSRAELTFPQPLEIELPPWQVPTNLIFDPLVSFTAVRGITTGLASLRAWDELRLGSPTQLFTWSLGGLPLQTYLAIPDADASNRVAEVATVLLDRARPYFATNAFGRLERTATGGLGWMDFPFLPASLEAVSVAAGDFIVAGWSPGLRANRSTPPELLAQFISRTNLVYYDWELSGTRVGAWTFLGQTLRLAVRRAQLPPTGSAQKWLTALSPKLGNCVTAAELAGTNSISVARTSGLGFSALELHLLADWLESPDFPHGLHSLNAQPDPRLYRSPRRAAGSAITNSPDPNAERP